MEDQCTLHPKVWNTFTVVNYNIIVGVVILFSMCIAGGRTKNTNQVAARFKNTFEVLKH